MKFIDRIVVAIVFLLPVTVLCSAGAVAQSGPLNTVRTGQWELLFHPQYTDGFGVESEGGSRADVNGDYGFGFGMNYNMSPRLALGFDYSWNEASYTATRILDNSQKEAVHVGGFLQSATMAFNADYYLTSGKIAPYVSGQLGWTFVDSNIPAGPPQGVCWWDPLWGGYVCGEYVPTKTTTEFIYGIGAGVRWDVSRGFFMRGSVDEHWVDLGGTASDVSVTTARLGLGIPLH